MSEDDIECVSFTASSIDSLLVSENKYYLQVHLDNWADKIKNKQMTGYLDENHLWRLDIRNTVIR